MAIEGRVKVYGLEPWLNSLRGLEEHAKDLGPVQQDWDREFSDAVAAIFRREGPGWKPLRPATVASRERLGYPGAHPILRRSERLAESLTNPRHADAVARGGKRRWERGTKVPYSVYLHPDRPFLPFGGEFVDKAAGHVVKWLIRPFKLGG